MGYNSHVMIDVRISIILNPRRTHLEKNSCQIFHQTHGHKLWTACYCHVPFMQSTQHKEGTNITLRIEHWLAFTTIPIGLLQKEFHVNIGVRCYSYWLPLAGCVCQALEVAGQLKFFSVLEHVVFRCFISSQMQIHKPQHRLDMRVNNIGPSAT